MPGLPGIHVLAAPREEDADGRDKPGHDENGSLWCHLRSLDHRRQLPIVRLDQACGLVQRHRFARDAGNGELALHVYSFQAELITR